MQIGIDEGYEPIQPIHFSHKIHAGDNQIDCKYCHSGARTSAVAGVPSLNVCMGCHNTISEYEGEEDLANGYTKEFYTKEIKKLYEAVGWDEQKFRYTGTAKPVQWVVHQHAPLTMGWCIECHRQMPANANNPYYQHYEEVHKALAKKLNVAKLTVAEMGGLECAKCHY